MLITVRLIQKRASRPRFSLSRCMFYPSQGSVGPERSTSYSVSYMNCFSFVHSWLGPVTPLSSIHMIAAAGEKLRRPRAGMKFASSVVSTQYSLAFESMSLIARPFCRCACCTLASKPFASLLSAFLSGSKNQSTKYRKNQSRIAAGSFSTSRSTSSILSCN